MAKPMTHGEFVDLLEEWDIPFETNSRGGQAWFNHNRGERGDGWGPVYGIGNHHTGGKDDKGGADVLWNGYGDLPGPLCHAGIHQNGHLLLNGWGRVNHFGLGDEITLKHVQDEDYTGTLTPHSAKIDGNARFYGFEWMYSGEVDPAVAFPKMYHTAVRLNAAICTHHNWEAESCIGHGEWQPGKWDPGYRRGFMMSMVNFRNHVEQAIEEGPKPKPKPPLPPRPVPPVPQATIVVGNGDTLISLAQKYLGNTARWTEFVTVNPTLVRALKPGEKLNLPKK